MGRAASRDLLTRLELAVDGHDGAAKTILIREAARQLEEVGRQVVVVSPFHEANAEFGSDIYPLWNTLPQMAVMLIGRSIQRARDTAPADAVILYDRHWLTVMVELLVLENPPGWTDFIPLLFARTTIDHVQRSSRFSRQVPWTSSDSAIKAYQDRYDLVAAAFEQHIVGTSFVSALGTDLSTTVKMALQRLKALQ